MTDSRLSTTAVEALAASTPDRRATAVAVEALSGYPAPERRLTARAVEVLSGYPAPERRFTFVALEVLTPTLLVDASYAGWGIKL